MSTLPPLAIPKLNIQMKKYLPVDGIGPATL